MSRVSFQMAKHWVERQGYLSDDYLAEVLEANSTASLPTWLREYLPRHLRGIPRKRGRKPRDPAVADFTLCWAESFYQRRLRHHQGKKLQECKCLPANAPTSTCSPGDMYKRCFRTLRGSGSAICFPQITGSVSPPPTRNIRRL